MNNLTIDDEVKNQVTSQQLDQILQRLSNIEAKLEEVKQNSNNLQRFDWAIDHADIGSFQYAHKCTMLGSNVLVKKILCYFRLGVGMDISDLYTNDKDVKQNDLVTRLCEHIYLLTGVRPFIADGNKDTKKFYIYESKSIHYDIMNR